MIEHNEKFKIPLLTSKGKRTFVNPMGEEGHPDPCIVYCEKEKCYYGISTSGECFWGTDNLVLHRSTKFEELFVNSESRLIYQSNEEDETYGYLWAPELHYIKGKWYIYTSCQNGPNSWLKHVIVLEAKTDSPFDGFEFYGHINRDVYAIDPSVYYDEEKDKLYLCTSPVIGGVQMLGIQELKSPGEPIGEMTIIAKAELPWELVHPYRGENAIVEGGYFVKSPNGRLFIFYSANGCWSDDYAIGVLELKGDNAISKTAWEKYPQPIFKQANGVFGTGHATFFRSPDKKELWICYHALETSNPSVEPMNRRCHCQKVFFDETGFPQIGEPIPINTPYSIPAE